MSLIFGFFGLVLLTTGGVARGAGDYPSPIVNTAADLIEAEALLNHKKWAEAAVVFGSVLRKNPDSYSASLGLARALTFSGRREEALSALWRQAEKEKGTRKAALIRRAGVISRLFLTSATHQTYQNGLVFLQTGKIRPAIEKFEEALEAEPDNAEILTRLGQALVLNNNFDSAAERLRSAKRLNRNEPEIRLWLGHTMHQRGEIKEAIEELKVAVFDLGGSERAVNWLAAAMVSFGQRAQGIQLLEEDVRARPFHLENLIYLALLRSQQPAKDKRFLWQARKDLQVAISRLEDSLSKSLEVTSGFDRREQGSELSLDTSKSLMDLKSEALRALQKVDNQLSENG